MDPAQGRFVPLTQATVPSPPSAREERHVKADLRSGGLKERFYMGKKKTATVDLTGMVYLIDSITLLVYLCALTPVCLRMSPTTPRFHV